MLLIMKYAYIDEYGAYGFKFSDPGCTASMILTAVLVEDKDVNTMETAAEEISKKYFGDGEMKSKSIGKNHQRRMKIINDIMELPFKVYVFVIDKTKIYENCGPRYKPTFYKFFNSKIYNELYTNFKDITIVADNVGGSEYIKEFSAYVNQKVVKQLSFFDDHNFMMNDSKGDYIIQIADIISGSLAYTFDEKKKQKADGNDYYKLLQENDKVVGIGQFPYSYDTYTVESQPADENFDPEIAATCYRRVMSFIQANEDKMDEDVKMQVITLKYLLFRFANNKLRKFISTHELKSNLASRGFGQIDTLKFRTKVIGKLRDADVIISSNSKGYKIPATKAELYDYVNLEQSIIVPIIARLTKCRNLLYEGTDGNFDLFEKDEYELLRKIIES